MKILACLAVLTLACHDSPGPGVRGIIVNPDIIKVYNQDKAMLLFESMVEDQFDVRLNNVWADTTVWWTDTPCPYRDDNAVVYRSKCYHGIMWSCSEMYVAVQNGNQTCGTALLHEFGHCLSHHVLGHYSSDHTGPIWPVVDIAYAEACARGW